LESELAAEKVRRAAQEANVIADVEIEIVQHAGAPSRWWRRCYRARTGRLPKEPRQRRALLQLDHGGRERPLMVRARRARLVVPLCEVLGELLDDLFVARGVAGDLG